MKTVIIDNYDSFTFNLARYIAMVTGEFPHVVRNDKFDLGELDDYDCIVLSPGPGLPKDAGLTMATIEAYHRTKNILGVCLGHQALGEFFGGRLKQLSTVQHGVATPINIIKRGGVFKGIPNRTKVGRYHSWALDTYKLPRELQITSITDDDTIMSLRHKLLPIYGIQFHPESILTKHGLQMIENFYRSISR